MSWEEYTDNDWENYAKGWLLSLTSPDSEDVGQSIIMLNFMGSAEDNWKFILCAFEFADTDDKLGHIAAGPLEHFISKHGKEYIDIIEELAIKDPKFNRLLTGVWKHMTDEKIWNRVKVLQKRVNNPLVEYREDNKMFEDFKNKIENFYDLSETESDSFLEELNFRINRNPEGFKDFMSNLGYGFESDRGIYYEALIKLNPQNWHNYILNELKLLLSKAEGGDKNAENELGSVNWLTDISKMNSEFYYQTKSFLFTKLNSKIVEIRELSLTAIFDIFHHLNEKPKSEEVILLQECLKDSNFKNKIYAYSGLKEANLVPKDFKFTTIEKIKVKGYSKLVE